MATATATPKIGTNNEIPTGHGRIEHVRELIAKWFPEITFEVIATGGAGHIDEKGEAEQSGYLRFNLIVSYGMGDSTTRYMRTVSYRDFCEGEVGRMLGGLDVAHEMRNVCKRWVESSKKEIASWKDNPGASYSAAYVDSMNRRDNWQQALDAVPMYGWSLTK